MVQTKPILENHIVLRYLVNSRFFCCAAFSRFLANSRSSLGCISAYWPILFYTSVSCCFFTYGIWRQKWDTFCILTGKIHFCIQFSLLRMFFPLPWNLVNESLYGMYWTPPPPPLQLFTGQVQICLAVKINCLQCTVLYIVQYIPLQETPPIK